MKKSVCIWQLAGFVFVSLAGTLLHFVYDWTNKSLWAATVCAVNESTFEHMKLLFFPLFVFSLVQGCFFEDRKDFWCIKLKGTLLGVILIPVIFYTYNGVIGKSPDWVNIGIFFVCAAITYIYETRLFKKGIECKRPKLAFALLCIMAFLFVLLTFTPLNLNIFKDPVTQMYGITQ